MCAEDKQKIKEYGKQYRKNASEEGKQKTERIHERMLMN